MPHVQPSKHGSPRRERNASFGVERVSRLSKTRRRCENGCGTERDDFSLRFPSPQESRVGAAARGAELGNPPCLGPRGGSAGTV
jgi:hypothetical protein